MGARHNKVRLIAFVPASLMMRYRDLAERYGISRSELYRMSLEQGFKATKQYCERRAAEFLVLTGDTDRPASPASKLAAAAAGAGSGAPPLDALHAYSDTLIEHDSGIDVDVFRKMVTAQSAVLGPFRVQVDPTIEYLVDQHFGSGSARSDPGEAAAAPVDVDAGVDAGSVDDGTADRPLPAAVQPGGAVPDLD